MSSTPSIILQIAAIRTDGGTQTRAALNSDTVRDYAEAMSRGEQFPPVVVFYDGTDYWLADGFHRVQAANDVGHAEIEAEIRQGTRRDAILYSVQANATHGLPRSDEDKRRAVIKLLEDDEWKTWSDREIARRTKTTHPFVGKLRRDMFGDAVPDERTYTTKHGTEATMVVTGNITSENAARAAAPLTAADQQEQANMIAAGQRVARRAVLDILGRRGRQEMVILLEGVRRQTNMTGAPLDDMVAADEIVREETGGKIFYDLPAASPSPRVESAPGGEVDFADACDALIVALASGPLTRNELHNASLIDNPNRFAAALKFQHSAERLAMRRDPDGQVRFYLPAPRTGPHPHSIAAEKARIEHNNAVIETARANGTLTYNGIPYSPAPAAEGEDSPLSACGEGPGERLDTPARDDEPLTPDERALLADLADLTEPYLKAWWDGVERETTPVHRSLITRGLIQPVMKWSSGSEWCVGFIPTANAGIHPASDRARYKQIKRLKDNGNAAVGGVNERLDDIAAHLSGIDAQEFARFIIQHPNSDSLAPVIRASLDLLPQIEAELTRLLAIAHQSHQPAAKEVSTAPA